MTNLPLASVHVRNFKAIRDSGEVRLGALNIIIGANGSGKSSLLEAIETVTVLADRGLDAALGRFRGFEHIHHKLGSVRFITPLTQEEKDLDPPPERQDRVEISPIEFTITGHCDGADSLLHSEISSNESGDNSWISREIAKIGKRLIMRGPIFPQRPFLAEHVISVQDDDERRYPASIVAGQSIQGLPGLFREALRGWQFIALDPLRMGEPAARSATGQAVALASNGSNLADYIYDLYDRHPETFQLVVDKVRDVLPYASDLTPVLASELQRSAYLRLAETGVDAFGVERAFVIPGWLLSTGTLRIVALLALLNHPAPPSVLFVDEIENGLDPNTIRMLYREIKDAAESGRTQVIATSHSPFLLDLVSLDEIIFVERTVEQPVFSRPADAEELRGWAERFKSGELYVMGRMAKQGAP